MRDYKLTKQAFKQLKLLAKNDRRTAEKLKNIIIQLGYVTVKCGIICTKGV